MIERKTIDVKRSCIICGEDFNVRIRKSDSKIISKCFYSTIRKYIFLRWTWRIDIKKKDFLSKKNCQIEFSNNFWKIFCYTSPQRWIIYKIWWLFRGWQRIEYWECKECC